MPSMKAQVLHLASDDHCFNTLTQLSYCNGITWLMTPSRRSCSKRILSADWPPVESLHEQISSLIQRTRGQSMPRGPMERGPCAMTRPPFP
jgi:hypothetical protein